VVFAAETLGCTPAQTRDTAGSGFDFIFNSSKWWDYRSPWLLQLHHLTRHLAPSIGFPESLDTPRLAEDSGGNPEVSKQRYLFTALFSAGCLMPIGYEFCFRRRLQVVHTRATGRSPAPTCGPSSPR
jgi:starch synthase (maltosyl-transferring)